VGTDKTSWRATKPMFTPLFTKLGFVLDNSS
jgi:hypothetical protein